MLLKNITAVKSKTHTIPEIILFFNENPQDISQNIFQLLYFKNSRNDMSYANIPKIGIVRAC